MVKQYRLILIILFSSLLLACASARMAEEVQSGKVAFDSGNFKQAFIQLLPLAVKCSPEAQYAVGYMYYYGLGVEAHKESGLFWINQAAKQMYRPAIRALQIIDKDKAQSHTPRRKSNKLRYSESILSESLKDPEIQKKIASIKKENKVEQDPLRMAVKVTPENKEKDDEVLLSLPRHPRAGGDPFGMDSRLRGNDKIVRSSQDTKSAVKIVEKESKAPVQKTKVAAASEKFTLQLFGSYKLDDVKQLQSRLKLQHATYYALTQNKGRDWYVLTYGKYPVVSSAKLAKNNMPKKAQKLNPWIRNTGELRWLG
jgi:DamX protein